MRKSESKSNGATRRSAPKEQTHEGASRNRGAGARPMTRTSYDALKEFKGSRYTGMKVGRGHHWIYDSGEWVETKVTPDKWEFHYAVDKRRKGRAPEGSGVPVGTAYHWYILADQTVRKLDANTYCTEMVGMKYKLAHRRADKQDWSTNDAGRRKRLIGVLRAMIAELESAAPGTEPAAPTASRKPKATRKKQTAATSKSSHPPRAAA